MGRSTRYGAQLDALLMRAKTLAAVAVPDMMRRAAGPDPDGRTWYRIENKQVSAGPATVHLYDDIGFWGVTADAFLEELAEVGSRDLVLRINSHGGEVFDGVAIFNALQRHAGKITGHVDGLAASAASFIAMACDDLVVELGGQMMIHDAHGMCYGSEADARAIAEMLGRTSQTIAAIYAERAGGTPDAWRELMRAETWYDGPQAVAAKLADRVGEPRARQRQEEGAPDLAPSKATDNRVDAGQTAYYGEAPGERDDDGRFKGVQGGDFDGFMLLDAYSAAYDVHDEYATANGLTCAVMSNGDFQLALDDPDRPGGRTVFADIERAQMTEFGQALQAARRGDEGDEFVVGDESDPVAILASLGDGEVNLRLWSGSGDGETEHEFDLTADEVWDLDQAITDVLDVDLPEIEDTWRGSTVWAAADSTSDPVSSTISDHPSAHGFERDLLEAWA